MLLSFNTPFFPEILIASSVLAEGVDRHLACRHVIHHDLCWNPSTLEQRTGRVDRLGAKADTAGRSIHVYLPYIAQTQDEKMYRVVCDRERWFQVVMGEHYRCDEWATDRLAARVPLPRARPASWRSGSRCPNHLPRSEWRGRDHAAPNRRASAHVVLDRHEPARRDAGEGRARRACDRVALTPNECGTYLNGGRRFEHIVRFATVDTAKAGWLLKNKGTWTVTEAGRAAHARFTEPEVFYREARRLYRVWEESQPTVEQVPAVEPDDGTRSGRAAAEIIEEAEEQAWQEIERFLHQMNPYDLQELVASLIKGMGYHIAWVAPPGRDGGMDIIAYGDPLGTRPPRIEVQVKRHASAIPVEGLSSPDRTLGRSW